MAADGSIIIDTRIQTDGLSKGLNAIKAGMARITAQVSKMGETAKNSFQRQIATVNDLYQNYEKQERKIAELKYKLDELGKRKVETEEYKQISAQIKALETDFENVESKQREWLNMGFPLDSGPVKELDKQLDEIWIDMEKLQNKQKEMQISGSAYIDPKTTDAYKNILQKYNEESQKLERTNGRLYSSYNNLKKKVNEYQKKNNRLILVMQNLQKAAARVGAVMKNIGSASKNAGLAVKSMVSAIKKAVEAMFNLNKQTGKTRTNLTRMLGMSLMFSGVFRAINAVSNGMKTGFENLAQYSNTTNTAISSLISSLTRLKNSFATAFAPVLTVVAPIISKFINMISKAITYVGMFVAALTGQDTFVKAVGIQEDYAAGLQKTSENTKQAAKNTKKANEETEGYLSTLDEIQQYTSNKNDNAASGDSDVGNANGYVVPDPSEMFKEVPIVNSIKGITDKIKKLIRTEDWEGLGEYVASGVNKGLKKVYNVIDWNKTGPKITKFCNAFTRTFNSLSDDINWELLGRTVGTGINTIVNTADLLITGVKWKNLGKKFANGITGFVTEVNWKSLGKLMANRFMISWSILNGIVHDLPYSKIGKAVADGLNGVFLRLSFGEIADTLATGLNGTFITLYSFTRRFDWTKLVSNISGGINTFIEKFDWEGNSEKLEAFLDNLCGALVDIAHKTNWEELGRKIGEFISGINWWEHLKQIANAIKDTLDDLFDGLEESSTVGKVVAFLSRVFVGIKIANIFGIDDLVIDLVKFIAKKLFTADNITSVANAIKNLFGGGTAEAATSAEEMMKGLGTAANAGAGGFSALAKAVAPWIGAAGLCAALAIGIGEIATKVSSLIDSANGGNGTITDFGYTVDNLIRIMQNSNTITADQKNQLFLLKEQLEDTNASADEYGTSLADAMAKGKVSSDDLQAAVSQLKVEMNLTEDETEMLTSLLDQMGQKTDEMATKTADSATLSKEQWSSMKDSLLDLYTQGVIPLDDQLTELSGTLQSQEAAGATAEAAYNKMEKEMKNMGMTNEDISTVLSTLFPEATMAVKTAVDTNIVGAQEQISSSMATAKADVEDATSSMASNANTNAESIKKGTDDSFKEVSKSSKTEWKDSYQAVNEALEKMEKSTLEAMKNIMGYIQSYWKSVVIDTNSTWELMDRKVEKALSNMASSAENYGNKMANSLVNAISGSETSITRILNNIASRVNSMVENINNSIAGIERGFTFSYNLQLPNGARKWGNYSLSLPRVNTVPYLAKGAVIPPRSEFLAVLGDQKQGNNIETPEALLRKIVREESGNQQGSSEIRVIAQINRRVLFDEFIKEAKARQEYSGKNPLELA